MVDENHGIVMSTAGSNYFVSHFTSHCRSALHPRTRTPTQPLLIPSHPIPSHPIASNRVPCRPIPSHNIACVPWHDMLRYATAAVGVWCVVRGVLCQVRVLSTLDREALKPNASVALHRHSHSVVDILPPEADSTIQLMTEKPDVKYSDIGGMDIQKQANLR